MSDVPRYRAHLAAAASLGHPIPSGGTVLDLGCRGDRAVADLVAAGYDAYGCDFTFPESETSHNWIGKGRLRTIGSDPYRLPFDDDTFDLVFSNQVFEHVQNYAETLAEIARVLKPDGVSLHVFPSRYSLIEQHVKVPLAGFVRARWWLWLWAGLGVRAGYQTDHTAKEVVAHNRQYLARSTNYLRPARLRQCFEENFSQVRMHCLRHYFRHYPEPRMQRRFAFLKRIPFSFRILEVLSTRVVFLARPSVGTEQPAAP